MAVVLCRASLLPGRAPGASLVTTAPFAGSGGECLYTPSAPPQLKCPVCRFRSQLQNSGQTGSVSIDVDLTQIPLNPVVAVQPGDTWFFQLWYRDVGNTSNTTDGVQVDFCN